MSPSFTLQRPYVVAALPRSIESSSKEYMIGQVYGASESKKRKRPELAVGVDGEGVNIYDVSFSKLITSYALPPQCNLSCPPCSLRIRISRNMVVRKTYVSTSGPKQHIALFNEVSEKGQAVKQTTVKHDLSESVVFMELVPKNKDAESGLVLILVQHNGGMQCLDGNSLKPIWTSPAATIWRDATAVPHNAVVEFASLTKAYAVSQGMLKDRADVLALYPHQVSEAAFDPEIMILITKSTTKGNPPARTLHVLALPWQSDKASLGAKSLVNSLLATDLPAQSQKSFTNLVSFNIDICAGTLDQLESDMLTSFDLNSGLPKLSSTLPMKDAKSLLRLSCTSIVVMSGSSIKAYNPRYGSIMTSLRLEDAGERKASISLKRKRGSFEEGPSICSRQLITHFPKLGLITAILDSNLVAIQVQSDEARSIGYAGTGLLIDSIGCSAGNKLRRAGRPESVHVGLTSLAQYTPGSIESVEAPWNEQISKPEALLAEGNTFEFEKFMKRKLGFTKRSTSALPSENGHKRNSQACDHTGPSEPLYADRRWVLYALGKIFEFRDSNNETRQLNIKWLSWKLFQWLMEPGNITATNIEAALKDPVSDHHQNIIGPGQLIKALVKADPEMKLVLGTISSSYLDAHELLQAIKELMRSLGLLAEKIPTETEAPKVGIESSEVLDGTLDEAVERIGTEVEEELRVVEYRLGPGSDTRGQALSLALSKLYTCPPNTIVQTLQAEFNSQEIVSLMYLLRVELVRGGWTTKYMDLDQAENRGEEADVSDNAIILISSLLNNCIDAIGAGGWLSASANLINGDFFESEDLVTGLKLEVTAALDGIEDVIYLRGLTSEMIRFGDAVQDSQATYEQAKGMTCQKRKSTKSSQPITISATTQSTSVLPMGLKTDRKISQFRVGAGGEIIPRSTKEIAYLESRNVGKYTFERVLV